MSKSVLDWMYEQKNLPSPHYQVETKRSEDVLVSLLRNLDIMDQNVGKI